MAFLAALSAVVYALIWFESRNGPVFCHEGGELLPALCERQRATPLPPRRDPLSLRLALLADRAELLSVSAILYEAASIVAPDDMAVYYDDRARVLWLDVGRFERADAALERVVAWWADPPPHTSYDGSWEDFESVIRANHLAHRSRELLERGRTEEARETAYKAIDFATDLTPDLYTANTQLIVADLSAMLEMPDAGMTLANRALVAARAKLQALEAPAGRNTQSSRLSDIERASAELIFAWALILRAEIEPGSGGISQDDLESARDALANVAQIFSSDPEYASELNARLDRLIADGAAD